MDALQVIYISAAGPWGILCAVLKWHGWSWTGLMGAGLIVTVDLHFFSTYLPRLATAVALSINGGLLILLLGSALAVWCRRRSKRKR